MLVEHLARYERKMIVLLCVGCLLHLVPSKLIIKLFLIIEEKELVLENVGTSDLHSVLLLKVLLDSLQSFTLFLQPNFFLELSVVHLFSHLLKVRLQYVLVGKPLTQADLLPKLENVAWIF